MKKIDIFTHILPDRYSKKILELDPVVKDINKRVRDAVGIMSLDDRFRVMDKFGDYAQIAQIGQRLLDSLLDSFQLHHHDAFALGQDIGLEDVDLDIVGLDQLIDDGLVAGFLGETQVIHSGVHSTVQGSGFRVQGSGGSSECTVIS